MWAYIFGGAKGGVTLQKEIPPWKTRHVTAIFQRNSRRLTHTAGMNGWNRYGKFYLKISVGISCHGRQETFFSGLTYMGRKAYLIDG